MEKENMIDTEAILKSIRKSGDKDSKAYKITVYYETFTTSNLDEGGIALVASKVLSIEKELRKWVVKHPNIGTILQPEEQAIILIDHLRKQGFLR